MNCLPACLLSCASLQHTAFLAATLLSEVNSMFHLLTKLLTMAGTRAGSLLATMDLLDHLTFFLFRLLPHAYMILAVATSPAAFSTRAYFWLAAAGMAYMNAANVQRAVGLLAPAPAKPHAE